MNRSESPKAELLSVDPLNRVYTYHEKETIQLVAGQFKFSLRKNDEEIGTIIPSVPNNSSGAMLIKDTCIGEYELIQGVYRITPYKEGREKEVSRYGIHPLDYLLSKLELTNCIDFFKEKQRMLDSRDRKRSTIEYKAFELCKKIVDYYEKDLEREEQNLNKQLILVQSNFKVSYDMFHSSIFVLQSLCGANPSYEKHNPPRTLEEALLSAGVEEKEVKKEKMLCEEYLQKTTSLYWKSRELCDRDTDLTYNLLMRKFCEGKKLTPEEEKALNWAGEILSSDH